MNRSLPNSPIIVAGTELQEIALSKDMTSELCHCSILLHNKFGKSHEFRGFGYDVQSAIAATLQRVTRCGFELVTVDRQKSNDGADSYVAIVRAETHGGSRLGFGRSDSETEGHGILIAILKGLNHLGVLRSEFAANNQKHLRSLAEEQVSEMMRVISANEVEDRKRLELESMLMEHSNRIASSSVISSSNVAVADSALYMFDTSAWLYDGQGRRRTEFIDTDLWLAWYPGLECDDSSVNEILDSLPKVESTKLPWIVRALESPESWLRFRGAISLEDHDILHVLLGRGLQDQDEAFVLGFAMGTSIRYSVLQHYVFRWLLSTLYPEPYRIPKFLLPAFDLGLECGRKTGRRNLYRESLTHCKEMTVRQARESCEIDTNVLREFYREERKRIPFTIASIRLP